MKYEDVCEALEERLSKEDADDLFHNWVDYSPHYHSFRLDGSYNAAQLRALADFLDEQEDTQ